MNIIYHLQVRLLEGERLDVGYKIFCREGVFAKIVFLESEGYSFMPSEIYSRVDILLVRREDVFDILNF